MSNCIEMIGNRYGRLTVISVENIFSNGRNRKFCKCKCDCGNYVTVRLDHISNGHTTSCGCYHKDAVSKVNKGKSTATLTHGLSKTRLYGVFRDMKTRCYNPNSLDYKNYGGRGIRICNEWLKDYTKFADWAYKNGYDENAKKMVCTIDRIDNNGNYEPTNCRWVGMGEQNRNQRKRKCEKMNLEEE